VMSPTLKKVLLIGGAAVAGYVIYTKVIKKAPAPVVELPKEPITGGLKLPPQHANATVTTTEGSRRGVAGYLGSLGSYR